MIEDFSGFQVDQAQAEFFSAAAQTVDHSFAMELEISLAAGSAIGEVATQDTVDQDRKFAGGGGDGLGRTEPGSETAIIGPQGSTAAGQAHGGTAQHCGGTIGRRLRSGAEQTL